MNKATQVFNKLANLSSPTSDFLNDSILQNIDYGRYLVGHKINLGDAGIQMGLSPGKILAHDYTKFDPKRFDVYEDYFYGPRGMHGKLSPQVYKNFKQEVAGHYASEPHHNYKLGIPEDMQTHLENIADWYSVGKTNASMQGKSFPNFVDWWNSRKLGFLGRGSISKEVFVKVEKQVAKDYNIFSYTIDQIKEIFK